MWWEKLVTDTYQPSFLNMLAVLTQPAAVSFPALLCTHYLSTHRHVHLQEPGHFTTSDTTISFSLHVCGCLHACVCVCVCMCVCAVHKESRRAHLQELLVDLLEQHLIACLHKGSGDTTAHEATPQHGYALHGAGLQACNAVMFAAQKMRLQNRGLCFSACLKKGFGPALLPCVSA